MVLVATSFLSPGVSWLRIYAVPFAVFGIIMHIYGEVMVSIEGLGIRKIIKLEGVRASAVIAAAGAVLSGKAFLFPAPGWDAGYRPSDNTILVRKCAT
jgi:hypothetical protein